MKLSLPKKNLEVILKFKVAVEKFQSSLLLKFIFITIPEMKLNIIYELVHISQRQDLLKTHLHRDHGHQ